MSAFDDAFSQTTESFHSVFGELATYTIADTSEEVEVRFLLDDLQTWLEGSDGSRVEVRQLMGRIRRGDLDCEPAAGDTIEFDAGDGPLTYRLTQTPTNSQDLSGWDCEFRNEQAIRRGGNNVIPFI